MYTMTGSTMYHVDGTRERAEIRVDTSGEWSAVYVGTMRGCIEWLRTRREIETEKRREEIRNNLFS